jgi:hypothetical protein
MGEVIMSRPYLLLLVASLAAPGLWAQNPGSFFDKAPPDVEEALRARIAGFYQAHVDKKFRQADEYVAADTKDFYYEANKPAYLGFEIGKITYSDNFTKAKAVVSCKIKFGIPGFDDNPVMAPIPSSWKLENGQWYWYVDQTVGRETPFGVMPPAAGKSSAGGFPSLAAAPSIDTLWKNVVADKNAVQLSGKESSSEQVTISNKMPGNIWLQVDIPKTPGLAVSLDRGELKSGEEATITFRSEPQEKPVARVAQVRVTVVPTNQVIPITVAIR